MRNGLIDGQERVDFIEQYFLHVSNRTNYNLAALYQCKARLLWEQYQIKIIFFEGFLISSQYNKMRVFKLIFCYYRGGSEQASTMFKCVDLNKDYYKVLELHQNAAENDIKKSYLKLVKKLHPDMNPSGHQLFTEVQEAYHILSDRKLKKYYDQNNSFYASFGADHQRSKSNYEDPRNEQFYDKMKGDYRSDFKKKQEESKSQQSDEEAQERRKFEQEIKLTRKILFTRNPIWQTANAFMNYEERQRRVEEKQKEFQKMFPNSSKIKSSFKKWIF